LLGIDHGMVRIGLAICDTDRIMASPLETYTRKNTARDTEYYRQVVRKEEVVGIIVGLPIHMSGNESTQSDEARRYASWLHTITGLPIALHDERCTSSAAEDTLWAAGLTHKQRKARRDQLAAQLILQAYLDTNAKSIATSLPSEQTLDPG